MQGIHAEVDRTYGSPRMRRPVLHALETMPAPLLPREEASHLADRLVEQRNAP